MFKFYILEINSFSIVQVVFVVNAQLLELCIY